MRRFSIVTKLCVGFDCVFSSASGHQYIVASRPVPRSHRRESRTFRIARYVSPPNLMLQIATRCLARHWRQPLRRSGVGARPAARLTPRPLAPVSPTLSRAKLDEVLVNRTLCIPLEVPNGNALGSTECSGASMHDRRPKIVERPEVGDNLLALCWRLSD